MDDLLETPFYAVPQNLIMAYRNGDIAYILGATLPIRNNSALYMGCRVLDGTTTKNDWLGYLPNEALPRVINPKKGYIVTANNRQVPENFYEDHGATITTTARAQRITELIQIGLDRGHKFDYKDMLTIQNDTVDIIARDLLPYIVKVAKPMIKELPYE